MNCMKCGREISEGQAFCQKCLDVMAEYPVRPGTYVRIPPRKDYEDVKQPRRKKELTPEEHIAVLQNKVHWLSIAVVALLATSILLGLFLLRDFMTQEEEQPSSVSRNYTVTQTEDK